MSIDKISVFKIKSTATKFSDFFRLENPVSIPITKDHEAAYEIEVIAAFKEFKSAEKTQANIPWLVFLNDGLPAASRFSFKAANLFPSAIVGIKFTENGIDSYYAIAFGLAGDSHIDPDYIVRDFGIRVAMNICDEEKLKRIQSTRHAEVSTQSERQLSVGSSFSVFDIDDEKEFLQVIAGAARVGDYEFIQSFVGRENISIKSNKENQINWNNLIGRVHKLSNAYDLKNYEKTFPGYAKFHFETDVDIISELEEKLFELISNRDFSSTHLAPPEVVDYSTCEFSYGKNETKYEDLTLSDLLSSRRAFGEKSSLDSIKGMRIFVWNIDTGAKIRHWSAFKCLVAEVTHDGESYILSNGQWKRVGKELRQEIESYLAELIVDECKYLPHDIEIWNPVTKRNEESVFNVAASALDKDLLLLDRAKIEIAGKRLYEVCDLLHLDRSMIQVKRMQNSSSSVSHLFLQGRFYAEAFVTDELCRTGFRDEITKRLGADAGPFLDIVPTDRSFNTKDYKIIFCILSENNIVIADMPFMARYELVHSHRFLRKVMGMNCSVVFRRIKVKEKVA